MNATHVKMVNMILHNLLNVNSPNVQLDNIMTMPCSHVLIVIPLASHVMALLIFIVQAVMFSKNDLYQMQSVCCVIKSALALSSSLTLNHVVIYVVMALSHLLTNSVMMATSSMVMAVTHHVRSNTTINALAAHQCVSAHMVLSVICLIWMMHFVALSHVKNL